VRRALGSIAQLADIDLEFVDGPAQCVAMHSKLARGSALVALILLKNGEDKALLKFAHAFGVKDVAFVHLQDECFQLIFHGRSLSRSISFVLTEY
jgi:hypothetical protein